MDDAITLLNDAARLLERAHPDVSAELAGAAGRLERREWNVLVSGLCSVGKSSFVCALWGDSELLPTAVRDCTQTNTLIRRPDSGAADRRIFLKYLRRTEAENFALNGLAFHRLTEMVHDFHGIEMPRLDEMLPDARLRYVAREARRIYSSDRSMSVLNEPLTDELEQLENFIAYLDSPEYRPGEAIEARWEDRREHLMGRRLLDGRLAGTGRLMSLEHVELARETAWAPANGLPPPVLVDTPWVPAVHNARREDLILDQARRADILLVLALPQRFECESWLLKLLRKRPELAKTTVFVLNQADTCDPRTLFSRDGFAGIFEDNRERLTRLGFDPANILVACARLRFLQNALKEEAVAPPKDAAPFGGPGIPERIARLEKVLGQMREQARTRPDGDLKQKLLAACDPADAGVETVRRRLEELASKLAFKRRLSDALKTAADFRAPDLPLEQKPAWEALRKTIRQRWF